MSDSNPVTIFDGMINLADHLDDVPWMQNLPTYDQNWVALRVQSLERSIPSLLQAHRDERKSNFPKSGIIGVIGDIIQNGQWELLREGFIVMHRRHTPFPLIWLPDVLDAPNRAQADLLNLQYLLPPIVNQWLSDAESSERYPSKAIERWKQQLFLLTDYPWENLGFHQQLHSVIHDINNQGEVEPKKLKTIWKRSNRQQRMTLIMKLPLSKETESFFVGQLKTRSAAIKSILLKRLAQAKGTFYSALSEVWKGLDETIRWQVEDWPDTVKTTICRMLQFSDEGDLVHLFPLINIYDWARENEEGWNSIWKRAPNKLRPAILESLLLHQHIGPFIMALKQEPGILRNLPIEWVDFLSPAHFGQLIDALIREKRLTADLITDILSNTRHFLPHGPSITIVRWLRHDILSKKPHLSEALFEVLAVRSDPKIYAELLAMKEQSAFFSADTNKHLIRCIDTMKLRIRLRQSVETPRPGKE